MLCLVPLLVTMASTTAAMTHASVVPTGDPTDPTQPSAAPLCIECAAGGGPLNEICNAWPCADDDDCDGWCNKPDCKCYLDSVCPGGGGAPGNCFNMTAHTFTHVPGRLTSGCDSGPLPHGCDVAPTSNQTLVVAQSICGDLDDCVGVSFQSPTDMPRNYGVVQVYFKGADKDCGHSRFGAGICPYTPSKGTWQTWLKDYKPRTPV